MSLTYTVKESLSGFTRTKLSTAISIVTIGISLMLLGLCRYQHQRVAIHRDASVESRVGGVFAGAD
jgi:cell division protein FtsX